MLLYGRRNLDELLEYAPTLSDSEGAPVQLPRTEVLQAMFEIDDKRMQDTLPRALHPTIPPTVTFVFWRCPEGPLGAFQLAQVRVGCRAGVSPRGFLVACWCDSELAAHELRRRWGFSCRPATLHLTRGYASIRGMVAQAGSTRLLVSLVDPVAISGSDIQCVANLHVARIARESGLETRLVLVEPHHGIRQADRGQPVLDHFDEDASTAGLTPVYPISASFTLSDITLPPIRTITDPERPALRGTESLLPD